MTPFYIAFNATMGIEGDGILTNDKLDSGGQTYSGISRVYWPDWAGWEIIDKCSQPFNSATMYHLDDEVRNFYRVNFWNRIQGDKLAELSLKIACEVFDSAVNVGVHQAVKFLQEGYNVTASGYYLLEVDGELGPTTLEMIAKYLSWNPGPKEVNEEILLNCANGEQYIFYKSNPKHKYFRGWFRRV